MPDFSASFTSGATLVAWTDPPDATRPTRLNPIIGHGHLRRVGVVGDLVSITARVGLVTAPLDTALGGRLFLGMFAETPGAVPPITSPAGQSSVVSFTPTVAGHYTFMLRRAGGGGLALHLDVA
jgi:hypothetical protein